MSPRGKDRRKKNHVMTAEEVSVFLRIPLSTLYGLSKKGKIRGVKVGKHWRYLASDIFALLYGEALRGTALSTALIFFLVNISFAQPVPPISSHPSNAMTFHLEQVKIPETLGSLEAFQNGSNADPTIIYIQDAHAIFDAQKSIEGLIHYFQEKGVRLVALEGGAGELDATLFQAFPDDFLRRKVMEDYEKRGEITGPQMAAVSGQGVEFYGIEDWDLYEENYLAYLRAIEQRDQALEALEKNKAVLDEKRKQVFSAKLSEFHEKVEAFREENSHLIELLKYLMQIASAASQPRNDVPSGTAKSGVPKGTAKSAVIASEAKQSIFSKEKYPHLAAIFKTLSMEDSEKTENLDRAIRQMAEAFKRRHLAKLDPKDQAHFNGAHQAYLSSQLDPAAFLKRLVETGERLGLESKLTPLMKELLGASDTLAAVKGTKLFDEIESLIQELRQGLVATKEEASLFEEYDGNRLLRDLANLELTRKQWEELKASFVIASKAAMAAKDAVIASKAAMAAKDAVIASPAGAKQSGVSEIASAFGLAMRHFQPQIAFYQLVEQRDRAFHKNLEALMKKEKVQTAIVVAGGFHGEGFEETFKEKGYSYAVITPRIQSLEGQEAYAAVMQGKLSYKHYLETNFYDAFTRHAAAKLMGEMDEPNFRRNWKLWRDEVIRKLSAEGRIDEAGEYTRYIDLLYKVYRDKFATAAQTPMSREELLASIEKVLEESADDAVSRMWQSFETQFKEFTSGLKNLLERKELNVQTVSLLLDRVSPSKPIAMNQFAALQTMMRRGPEGGALRPEIREFLKTSKPPSAATSATLKTPPALPYSFVTSQPNAIRQTLDPWQEESIVAAWGKLRLGEGNPEEFTRWAKKEYGVTDENLVRRLAQRAVLRSERKFSEGNVSGAADPASQGKSEPQRSQARDPSPNRLPTDSLQSSVSSHSFLTSTFNKQDGRQTAGHNTTPHQYGNQSLAAEDHRGEGDGHQSKKGLVDILSPLHSQSEHASSSSARAETRSEESALPAVISATRFELLQWLQENGRREVADLLNHQLGNNLNNIQILFEELERKRQEKKLTDERLAQYLEMLGGSIEESKIFLDDFQKGHFFIHTKGGKGPKLATPNTSFYGRKFQISEAAKGQVETMERDNALEPNAIKILSQTVGGLSLIHEIFYPELSTLLQRIRLTITPPAEAEEEPRIALDPSNIEERMNQFGRNLKLVRDTLEDSQTPLRELAGIIGLRDEPSERAAARSDLRREAQIKDESALEGIADYVKESLTGMGFPDLKISPEIEDIDNAGLPYPEGVNVAVFDAVQGLGEVAAYLASRNEKKVQNTNFILTFPAGGLAFGKNNPDRVFAKYGVFIKNGKIVRARFTKPIPVHSMVYGGGYQSSVRDELDRKGIPLLNSPLSLLVDDKTSLASLAKELNLPYPESMELKGALSLAEIETQIEQFVESHPARDLFLKPKGGMQGVGAEPFSKNDISEAAAHALKFLERRDTIILQEQISNDVFTKNGQVTDWILRVITTWEKGKPRIAGILVYYNKQGRGVVNWFRGAGTLGLEEFFKELGYDQAQQQSFVASIQEAFNEASPAIEKYLDGKKGSPSAYQHTGIVGWDVMRDANGKWYILEANLGSIGSLDGIEEKASQDNKGDASARIALYLTEIGENYRKNHADTPDQLGEPLIADSADVIHNMAWICWHLKNYFAAEQLEKYALTLDAPPTGRARYSEILGYSLNGQEKYLEAAAAFEKAYGFSPAPGFLYSQAEAFFLGKEYARATEILSKLSQLPDLDPALRQKASNLQAQVQAEPTRAEARTEVFPSAIPGSLDSIRPYYRDLFEGGATIPYFEMNEARQFFLKNLPFSEMDPRFQAYFSHPGIVSRKEAFFEFLRRETIDPAQENPQEVIQRFRSQLGTVEVFRAMVLNTGQFDQIRAKGFIAPPGARDAGSSQEVHTRIAKMVQGGKDLGQQIQDHISGRTSSAGEDPGSMAMSTSDSPFVALNGGLMYHLIRERKQFEKGERVYLFHLRVHELDLVRNPLDRVTPVAKRRRQDTYRTSDFWNRSKGKKEYDPLTMHFPFSPSDRGFENLLFAAIVPDQMVSIQTFSEDELGKVFEFDYEQKIKWAEAQGNEAWEFLRAARETREALDKRRAEVRMPRAMTEVDKGIKRNPIVTGEIAAPFPTGLNERELLQFLVDQYVFGPDERDQIIANLNDRIGENLSKALFPDAPSHRKNETWEIGPRVKGGFFRSVYRYDLSYGETKISAAANIPNGYGFLSEVVGNDLNIQNRFHDIGRTKFHPRLIIGGSFENTANPVPIGPMLLGRFVQQLSRRDREEWVRIYAYLRELEKRGVHTSKQGRLSVAAFEWLPDTTEIHFSAEENGTLPLLWEVDPGTGAKRFIRWNRQEALKRMVRMTAILAYFYESELEGGTTVSNLWPNNGDFVYQKDPLTGKEEVYLITMRSRRSGVGVPEFIDGLIHLYALDEHKSADELVYAARPGPLVATYLPISNPAIAFYGLDEGLGELHGENEGRNLARQWLHQYQASPLSEPYREVVTQYLNGALPLDTDFASLGFAPTSLPPPRAEVRKLNLSETKEFGRPDNPDIVEKIQNEKVLVSSNQEMSPASQGALQKGVIFRIAAKRDPFSRTNERSRLVDNPNQFLKVGGIKNASPLGSVKNSHEFGKQDFGDNQFKSMGSKRTDDGFSAASMQEGAQKDISVDDDAHKNRGGQAQWPSKPAALGKDSESNGRRFFGGAAENARAKSLWPSGVPDKSLLKSEVDLTTALPVSPKALRPLFSSQTFPFHEPNATLNPKESQGSSPFVARPTTVESKPSEAARAEARLSDGKQERQESRKTIVPLPTHHLDLLYFIKHKQYKPILKIQDNRISIQISIASHQQQDIGDQKDFILERGDIITVIGSQIFKGRASWYRSTLAKLFKREHFEILYDGNGWKIRNVNEVVFISTSSGVHPKGIDFIYLVEPDELRPPLLAEELIEKIADQIIEEISKQSPPISIDNLLDEMDQTFSKEGRVLYLKINELLTQILNAYDLNVSVFIFEQIRPHLQAISKRVHAEKIEANTLLIERRFNKSIEGVFDEEFRIKADAHIIALSSALSALTDLHSLLLKRRYQIHSDLQRKIEHAIKALETEIGRRRLDRRAETRATTYRDAGELDRDIAALEREIEAKGLGNLPRLGFHGEQAGHKPTDDFYYFVLDPRLQDYWREEWQKNSLEAKFKLRDRKNPLSLTDVFMEAKDFFRHLLGTVIFTSSYGQLAFSKGVRSEIYMLLHVPDKGFELRDKAADKQGATVDVYDPDKGLTPFPFFFVEGNVEASKIPQEAVLAKLGIEDEEWEALLKWAESKAVPGDENGKFMIAKFFAVRLLYKKILEKIFTLLPENKSQAPAARASNVNQLITPSALSELNLPKPTVKIPKPDMPELRDESFQEGLLTNRPLEIMRFDLAAAPPDLEFLVKQEPIEAFNRAFKGRVFQLLLKEDPATFELLTRPVEIFPNKDQKVILRENLETMKQFLKEMWIKFERANVPKGRRFVKVEDFVDWLELRLLDPTKLPSGDQGPKFPGDVSDLFMRIVQGQGILEDVIVQDNAQRNPVTGLLPVNWDATDIELQDALGNLSEDVIPELEKPENSSVVAGFQGAFLNRLKGYEELIRQELTRRAEARLSEKGEMQANLADILSSLGHDIVSPEETRGILNIVHLPAFWEDQFRRDDRLAAMAIEILDKADHWADSQIGKTLDPEQRLQDLIAALKEPNLQKKNSARAETRVMKYFDEDQPWRDFAHSEEAITTVLGVVQANRPQNIEVAFDGIRLLAQQTGLDPLQRIDHRRQVAEARRNAVALYLLPIYYARFTDSSFQKFLISENTDLNRQNYPVVIWNLLRSFFLAAPSYLFENPKNSPAYILQTLEDRLAKFQQKEVFGLLPVREALDPLRSFHPINSEFMKAWLGLVLSGLSAKHYSGLFEHEVVIPKDSESYPILVLNGAIKFIWWEPEEGDLFLHIPFDDPLVDPEEFVIRRLIRVSSNTGKMEWHPDHFSRPWEKMPLSQVPDGQAMEAEIKRFVLTEDFPVVDEPFEKLRAFYSQKEGHAERAETRADRKQPDAESGLRSREQAETRAQPSAVAQEGEFWLVDPQAGVRVVTRYVPAQKTLTFLPTSYEKPNRPSALPQTQISLEGSELPLKLTLGRSRKMEVRINDERVSRVHAEIIFSGEESFLVTDQNSTHGIALPGDGVAEKGVQKEVPLLRIQEYAGEEAGDIEFGGSGGRFFGLRYNADLKLYEVFFPYRAELMKENLGVHVLIPGETRVMGRRPEQLTDIDVPVLNEDPHAEDIGARHLEVTLRNDGVIVLRNLLAEKPILVAGEAFTEIGVRLPNIIQLPHLMPPTSDIVDRIAANTGEGFADSDLQEAIDRRIARRATRVSPLFELWERDLGPLYRPFVERYAEAILHRALRLRNFSQSVQDRERDLDEGNSQFSKLEQELATRNPLVIALTENREPAQTLALEEVLEARRFLQGLDRLADSAFDPFIRARRDLRPRFQQFRQRLYALYPRLQRLEEQIEAQEQENFLRANQERLDAIRAELDRRGEGTVDLFRTGLEQRIHYLQQDAMAPSDFSEEAEQLLNEVMAATGPEVGNSPKDLPLLRLIQAELARAETRKQELKEFGKTEFPGRRTDLARRIGARRQIESLDSERAALETQIDSLRDQKTELLHQRKEAKKALAEGEGRLGSKVLAFFGTKASATLTLEGTLKGLDGQLQALDLQIGEKETQRGRLQNAAKDLAKKAGGIESRTASRRAIHDFYAKVEADLGGRNVSEISRKHGVIFVHGISNDFVPGENSLLKYGVDWREKLEILMALSPTLSTSTFRPGSDGIKNLWAPYGVILNGGFVRQAASEDIGTVAAGVDRRVIRQHDETWIDEQLKKAIDQRAPTAMNELVVANPEVAGLYVYQGDRDGVILEEGIHPREMFEAAQKLGLPIFILNGDGIVEAEFREEKVKDRVLGTMRVIPRIVPKESTQPLSVTELTKKKNATPQALKEELLSKMLSNSPFRFEAEEESMIHSWTEGRNHYLAVNARRILQGNSIPSEPLPSGFRWQGEAIDHRGSLMAKKIVEFPGGRWDDDNPHRFSTFQGAKIQFFKVDSIDAAILKENMQKEALGHLYDSSLEKLKVVVGNTENTLFVREERPRAIRPNGGTIPTRIWTEIITIGRAAIPGAWVQAQTNEEYFAALQRALTKIRSSERPKGEDEHRIAFYLYGYADQSLAIGDQEGHDQALALARQTIPESEELKYRNIPQKRLGPNGEFRITPGDIRHLLPAGDRDWEKPSGPGSGLDQSRLLSALKGKRLDKVGREGIVEALRADPFLKSLYDDPRPLVAEGYNLRRHTLMAMGQFEKYFHPENLTELPGGVSRELIRAGLALHDAGKITALFELRNKDAQHSQTVQILNDIRPYLPFSAEEIDFLIALINGDPIGNYIKGWRDLNQTVGAIEEMFQQQALVKNRADFLRLLLIYYQSDASSYTTDAEDGLWSLEFLFEPNPQAASRERGVPAFHFENGRMKFSSARESKIRELEKAFGVVAPSAIRAEVRKDLEFDPGSVSMGVEGELTAVKEAVPSENPGIDNRQMVFTPASETLETNARPQPVNGNLAAGSLGFEIEGPTDLKGNAYDKREYRSPQAGGEFGEGLVNGGPLQGLVSRQGLRQERAGLKTLPIGPDNVLQAERNGQKPNRNRAEPFSGTKLFFSLPNSSNGESLPQKVEGVKPARRAETRTDEGFTTSYELRWGDTSPAIRLNKETLVLVRISKTKHRRTRDLFTLRLHHADAGIISLEPLAPIIDKEGERILNPERILLEPGQTFRIGRHRTNNLILEGEAQPHASRFHGILTVRPGGWVVYRDAGSLFGSNLLIRRADNIFKLDEESATPSEGSKEAIGPDLSQLSVDMSVISGDSISEASQSAIFNYSPEKQVAWELALQELLEIRSRFSDLKNIKKKLLANDSLGEIKYLFAYGEVLIDEKLFGNPEQPYYYRKHGRRPNQVSIRASQAALLIVTELENRAQRAETRADGKQPDAESGLRSREQAETLAVGMQEDLQNGILTVLNRRMDSLEAERAGDLAAQQLRNIEAGIVRATSARLDRNDSLVLLEGNLLIPTGWELDRFQKRRSYPRLEQWIQTIREIGPDFVILQEVAQNPYHPQLKDPKLFDTAQIIADRLGGYEVVKNFDLSHRFPGDMQYQTGQAILYRKENWAAVTEKKPSSVPVIVLRLRSPAGKEVIVVTTHLEPRPDGGEIRKAQLKRVQEIIREMQKKGNIPVILAGDFNPENNAETFDLPYADVFAALRPGVAGNTLLSRNPLANHLIRTQDPKRTLRVHASGMAPHQVYYLNSLANPVSDHFPVVATLRFSEERPEVGKMAEVVEGLDQPENKEMFLETVRERLEKAEMKKEELGLWLFALSVADRDLQKAGIYGDLAAALEVQAEYEAASKNFPLPKKSISGGVLAKIGEWWRNPPQGPKRTLRAEARTETEKDDDSESVLDQTVKTPEEGGALIIKGREAEKEESVLDEAPKPQPGAGSSIIQWIEAQAKAGPSDSTVKRMAAAISQWRPGIDPKDLEQAAYLKAVEKQAQLEGKPPEYIHTVSGNAMKDEIRREAAAHRQVDSGNLPEAIDLDQTDPSQIASQNEQSAILRTSITQLLPEEQQAIQLKYYEDRTFEEIATALKIPRTSVQRLIEQAEEKLRVMMTGASESEKKRMAGFERDINRLEKPHQKATMEARYLRALDYQQVSDELSIDLGTVRSRLNKIHTAFVQKLGYRHEDFKELWNMYYRQSLIRRAEARVNTEAEIREKLLALKKDAEALLGNQPPPPDQMKALNEMVRRRFIMLPIDNGTVLSVEPYALGFALMSGAVLVGSASLEYQLREGELIVETGIDVVSAYQEQGIAGKVMESVSLSAPDATILVKTIANQETLGSLTQKLPEELRISIQERWEATQEEENSKPPILRKDTGMLNLSWNRLLVEVYRSQPELIPDDEFLATTVSGKLNRRFGDGSIKAVLNKDILEFWSTKHRSEQRPRVRQTEESNFSRFFSEKPQQVVADIQETGIEASEVKWRQNAERNRAELRLRLGKNLKEGILSPLTAKPSTEEMVEALISRQLLPSGLLPDLNESLRRVALRAMGLGIPDAQAFTGEPLNPEQVKAFRFLAQNPAMFQVAYQEVTGKTLALNEVQDLLMHLPLVGAEGFGEEAFLQFLAGRFSHIGVLYDERELGEKSSGFRQAFTRAQLAASEPDQFAKMPYRDKDIISENGLERRGLRDPFIFFQSGIPVQMALSDESLSHSLAFEADVPAFLSRSGLGSSEKVTLFSLMGSITELLEEMPQDASGARRVGTGDIRHALQFFYDLLMHSKAALKSFQASA